MDFNEKRNFFRLPVEISARIRYDLSSQGQGPKFCRGVIRDLSGGGVKLDSTTKISDKENVNMRFSLPFNEPDRPVQDFYLQGEVIRSKKLKKKDHYEYGVKFVNILSGTEDRIVKYLFNLQISSRYHAGDSTKVSDKQESLS